MLNSHTKLRLKAPDPDSKLSVFDNQHFGEIDLIILLYILSYYNSKYIYINLENNFIIIEYHISLNFISTLIKKFFY